MVACSATSAFLPPLRPPPPPSRSSRRPAGSEPSSLVAMTLRTAAIRHGGRVESRCATAATLLLLAALACASLHLTAAQTPLTESVPVDGYVPAGSAVTTYSIAQPSPWPANAESLTINVTPIGDGNPDRKSAWSTQR